MTPVILALVLCVAGLGSIWYFVARWEATRTSSFFMWLALTAAVCAVTFGEILLDLLRR